MQYNPPNREVEGQGYGGGGSRADVLECPEGSGKVLVNGNCECPEGMVENGNGDCVDEVECGQPNDNGKCPCWGTTSDIDTSDLFSEDIILDGLSAIFEVLSVSPDAIELIRSMDIFKPEEITETTTKYIKRVNNLGAVGDGFGIFMSAVDYIEEPSTKNLLRLAFDGSALALPLAGSISVTVVELYRFDNGDSVIDWILNEAAILIEDLINCDLGAGIHHAFL